MHGSKKKSLAIFFLSFERRHSTHTIFGLLRLTAYYYIGRLIYSCHVAGRSSTCPRKPIPHPPHHHWTTGQVLRVGFMLPGRTKKRKGEKRCMRIRSTTFDRYLCSKYNGTKREREKNNWIWELTFMRSSTSSLTRLGTRIRRIFGSRWMKIRRTHGAILWVEGLR